ncbi:uncharacterized protein LOC123332738 isoform X8 [Bubalus bubalis]|uniref:uncharacterized protein LOC123332738 isoform X8 n=1 Tax=Bubalus bubalis TaxID=89462 RepID=UPI001E1B7E6B|nr:uncharacterized protein LOC123332738 isoform X8 [Bubalus bubalis]
MEPHEGRLTLLGSPHAATSPSPVSLAGERPDPRHGPAAEAGQDPTEHARPLAAASGRSRASRSGRAGVAQVRGPGAGLPLRLHTLQGPAGLRSATLDELQVDVGTSWVTVTEERTEMESFQRGESAGWRGIN